MLTLAAAWWLAVAATPATLARTPSPPPTPTPTPPSQGVLSLTPAETQPGTVVAVTGSQFSPGERVFVYLDTPDRTLLPAQADAQGGFKGDAPILGDVAPGEHQLCVAEQPAPRCASLRVLAKSTPAPTAAPATALPTPGGISSPGSLPTAQPTVSPVSLLLRPPFVLFPALLLLAAVGGCIFWIVQGRRRPAPVLPAARVIHRSTQFDEVSETPAAEMPPATPEPEPEPEPASDRPPPRRPPVSEERSDLPEPGD